MVEPFQLRYTLAMFLFAPSLPITSGLIIASPAGWLLGHATDTPYWDLPKGKREPGEGLLDAGLRECIEETGLDLRHHRPGFVALGVASYNRKRGKSLALFLLNLAEPKDLSQCRCSTWVATRGPRPVPDMDSFAWVPPQDLATHLKPRMVKHLSQRGLIEAPLLLPRPGAPA